MAIYDTMQFIKSKYPQFVWGKQPLWVLLLAAGEEGKRYALPNARIMIHQPLGGAQGQAADIEIQAKEIIRIKKFLNEILAKELDNLLKN